MTLEHESTSEVVDGLFGDALDYRAMFDAVPSPCVVLTVDGFICEVNSAYQRIVGRGRGDLVGSTIVDAFPTNPTTDDADAIDNLLASLRRAADTGKPDVMAIQRHDLLDPTSGAFELRFWSPTTVPLPQTGRVRLFLHRTEDITAYISSRGGPTGFEFARSGDFSDAEYDLFARTQELEQANAELRAARDQLAERALRDPLTGLFVRAVFLEAVEAALARLRRHAHYVGVLFLDLDRLKYVNDSYGHAVGDELLHCAAQRLRAGVRPSDAIGRIGGDEFVVLLGDLTSEQEALDIADRLLESLSEPTARMPREVAPVASIGVALTDDPGFGGEVLISHADAAMYRAKAAGRGRVERFDQEAYDALGHRNQTETELRGAAHAGQLRLHYQPIIDLSTGRRYAVEALLRWQHPRRGLLAAGEFLEIAENSSLIVDLGRWVVGEACRQLAHWDETLGSAAPERMFINLSTEELTHPAIGRVITDSASAAGIDPGRLVLEITETGLLTEPNRAVAVSRALSDLGCEIGIDDFGTGYSSLSRLLDLPARILKIDQSFVRGLSRSPESVAVVSAVLLLAHNLRKLVIAEGVEDAESLETLRELGCRYAQGFYLAAPTEALQ